MKAATSWPKRPTSSPPSRTVSGRDRNVEGRVASTETADFVPTATASAGRESLRLSFVADRPADEPGFVLERQERCGRQIAYNMRAHSAQKSEGERSRG